MSKSTSTFHGMTRRTVMHGALAGGLATLGLVGAVVGGFIFEALGTPHFYMGFDLASFLVAIIGAIVVLLIYHAITGRRGLR